MDLRTRQVERLVSRYHDDRARGGRRFTLLVAAPSGGPMTERRELEFEIDAAREEVWPLGLPAR